MASGFTAAQTGRKHDRTRSMLQMRKKVLAKAPSTHDPKRTWPPPYPTCYAATTNGSVLASGQQHAPSRFHQSNCRIGARVPAFGAYAAKRTKALGISVPSTLLAQVQRIGMSFGQSASVLFVGEISFETNFEEVMDMKTILVPMENSETMQSALETALLLGRRNNAYIEGFALRWPIIVAGLDMVGGLAIDSLKRDNLEEEKKARQFFEAFMRKMTCHAQLRPQSRCELSSCPQ